MHFEDYKSIKYCNLAHIFKNDVLSVCPLFKLFNLISASKKHIAVFDAFLAPFFLHTDVIVSAPFKDHPEVCTSTR